MRSYTRRGPVRAGTGRSCSRSPGRRPSTTPAPRRCFAWPPCPGAGAAWPPRSPCGHPTRPLPGPWSPPASRTTGSPILPPFLPRVAPGPGGRGILAILPSHLPRLAEATARALAPLARERELRLALTVATPELREAAAGWAPGAEVLPRPLREHEVTEEARQADAVVVLDPDDGFQRGILAAAGSGAAVVARPGGAAEGVLGAALATCADGRGSRARRRGGRPGRGGGPRRPRRDRRRRLLRPGLARPPGRPARRRTFARDRATSASSARSRRGASRRAGHRR